jgi:hypothetical protein
MIVVSRFRITRVMFAAAVVAGAMSGVVGSPFSIRTAAAADGDPPSIVEDFGYPLAAQILAQYNVRLVSGDGGILFADCTTPPTGDVGLIKVYSTGLIGAGGLGQVCFKVTKASGHVEVELPDVYEIRGDGQRTGTGHKTTAIVRTDAGQLPPVTVNPSGSTEVGIGIDDSNAATTLLQLVVTP